MPPCSLLHVAVQTVMTLVVSRGRWPTGLRLSLTASSTVSVAALQTTTQNQLPVVRRRLTRRQSQVNLEKAELKQRTNYHSLVRQMTSLSRYAVESVYKLHGSCRSLKVLEFFFQIFKAWKVLENRHGPWKSSNLCLKVLESAWIWFSKTLWTNQFFYWKRCFRWLLSALKCA